MPEMATYFGVNLSIIKFTVTFYYLGYALGSFFGGPLSDSFGRKPIAIIGIAVYGISSLFICLVNSVAWVLLFRLTQALGGGFATVTAIIFINDWFKGKQALKYINIISMLKTLAPLFAPTIGYFFIYLRGWKGVFYFLFTLASILFLLFLFIPESQDKSFTENKITAKELLKKYKVFFFYREPVLMLLSISFAMSAIYIFITEASFMYISYFKVAHKLFPLLFAGNVMLSVFSFGINIRLLKLYLPQTLVRLGLIIQLAASIALFVVAQLNSPPLPVVFCLISIIIATCGLTFGNASAIIVKYNPQVSGTASANLEFFRFVLGFLITSIIALFHSNNLIPMGTGMFCCAVAANVFFIFAMIHKNQQKRSLQKKS